MLPRCYFSCNARFPCKYVFIHVFAVSPQVCNLFLHYTPSELFLSVAQPLLL